METSQGTIWTPDSPVFYRTPQSNAERRSYIPVGTSGQNCRYYVLMTLQIGAVNEGDVVEAHCSYQVKSEHGSFNIAAPTWITAYDGINASQIDGKTWPQLVSQNLKPQQSLDEAGGWGNVVKDDHHHNGKSRCGLWICKAGEAMSDCRIHLIIYALSGAANPGANLDIDQDYATMFVRHYRADNS